MLAYNIWKQAVGDVFWEDKTKITLKVLQIEGI